MRIKELNIYQLGVVFFNLSYLFEKDPYLQKIDQMILDDVTEEVYNPKATKEGVRERQLHITRASAVTGFSGLIFYIVICIPIVIFFGINLPVSIILAIPFYCYGVSFYLALWRACRAMVDEFKFYIKGKPTDFVFSQNVYIRGYDFLMGIPIGVWSLFWW